MARIAAWKGLLSYSDNSTEDKSASPAQKTPCEDYPDCLEVMDDMRSDCECVYFNAESSPSKRDDDSGPLPSSSFAKGSHSNGTATVSSSGDTPTSSSGSLCSPSSSEPTPGPSHQHVIPYHLRRKSLGLRLKSPSLSPGTDTNTNFPKFLDSLLDYTSHSYKNSLSISSAPGNVGTLYCRVSPSETLSIQEVFQQQPPQPQSTSSDNPHINFSVCSPHLAGNGSVGNNNPPNPPVPSTPSTPGPSQQTVPPSALPINLSEPPRVSSSVYTNNNNLSPPNNCIITHAHSIRNAISCSISGTSSASVISTITRQASTNSAHNKNSSSSQHSNDGTASVVSVPAGSSSSSSSSSSNSPCLAIVSVTPSVSSISLAKQSSSSSGTGSSSSSSSSSLSSVAIPSTSAAAPSSPSSLLSSSFVSVSSLSSSMLPARKRPRRSYSNSDNTVTGPSVPAASPAEPPTELCSSITQAPLNHTCSATLPQASAALHFDCTTRTAAHYLLCALSDEVLLIIFSFLYEKDLSRVAQVCKRFHIIATDTELWKRLYQGLFEYDIPLLHPAPGQFKFVKPEDSEYDNPWKESLKQLYHGVHVKPRQTVWDSGRSVTVADTIPRALGYAKENEKPLVLVHQGLYKSDQVILESNVNLIGAAPGNVAEHVIIEHDRESSVVIGPNSYNCYIGHVTIRYIPPEGTENNQGPKHYSLEVQEKTSPIVEHCIIRSRSHCEYFLPHRTALCLRKY